MCVVVSTAVALQAIALEAGILCMNCKLLRVVILQSKARLGLRLGCQHVNDALASLEHVEFGQCCLALHCDWRPCSPRASF